MNRLLYNIGALLLLLTENVDMWFYANEYDPLKDKPYAYINLKDIIQFITEYWICDWWELITSPQVEPYAAPWSGNEHNPYHIANRDLGYPVFTASKHHRQWQQSVIESKGFVRD